MQPDIEAAFTGYLQEAAELRARKNKDYGNSWQRLGAKGVFVRYSDKTARLESLLWRGNEAAVKSESVRDTLIDALTYNLMLLYLVDKGAITEVTE